MKVHLLCAWTLVAVMCIWTQSLNEAIEQNDSLPGAQPPQAVPAEAVETPPGGEIQGAGDPVPETGAFPDTVSYPKVRLNVQGGFSWRIGSVDSDMPAILKDHVEEMKSGANISGDISLYFSKKYGLGFLYCRYFSSHTLHGLVDFDSTMAAVVTGDLEDEVSISFVGPGFFERKFYKNGEVSVNSSFALGYVSFVEKTKLFGVSVNGEGSTIGLRGALGMDFKLSPNLALGAEISYLMGTVSNFTANGQSVDGVKESMNRFDLNFGLRILR